MLDCTLAYHPLPKLAVKWIGTLAYHLLFNPSVVGVCTQILPGGQAVISAVQKKKK